ncbi:MAG TPA: hypothetical protein VMR74_04825 [Gammaproteobacteria bacterium]|nr:hypothetical protein [Gammaproteobacteria bacterium]
MGFFGVVVYTRVQTPRFWGDAASAGTLLFARLVERGLRTNWLVVDIVGFDSSSKKQAHCRRSEWALLAPPLGGWRPLLSGRRPPD